MMGKMLRSLSRFFSLFLYLKIRFYICFNRLWFWLIGVKYGKHLMVYDRVYIKGNGVIELGDDFLFLSGDCINPICRNLRGVLYTATHQAKILIGDRVGISSSCLWANERITIGNDVNIGGDCLIIDNDAHPISYQQRRRGYQKKVDSIVYLEKIKSAPVVIEDDVWIGARCQILKGVRIGARSIIAAGSIVTHDIPEDVIAGGNPCTIIKYLSSKGDN